MKNKVVELLKNSNLTIGSIESLTGGLFASNLTSIPGVSKVFKGSVVSYATEVKEMVVNVSKDVVTNYGVVSKECALEMALNGKKLLGVDVCVSFTGNAGPDVMDGKKVGTVYIGLIINDDIEVFELNLSGDRNKIREECVKIAFEKIYKKLSRTF